jgi:hypothetical protein
MPHGTKDKDKPGISVPSRMQLTASPYSMKADNSANARPDMVKKNEQKISCGDPQDPCREKEESGQLRRRCNVRFAISLSDPIYEPA